MICILYSTYSIYKKHQHHKFWRGAPGKQASPGSREAWSSWTGGTPGSREVWSSWVFPQRQREFWQAGGGASTRVL